MGRGEDGSAGRLPVGSASDLVLPSRSASWARLLASGSERGGLDLLTGEAGSGKSWLLDRRAARAAASAPDDPRWRVVEGAPGLDANGLLASIASALGMEVMACGSIVDLARRLGGCLSELSQDGRRLALAVDEAHLLADEALEAARLLANRLGDDDGFAAIVLAGQTPLRRRLEGRRLAAVAARIGSRSHLPPIDADEAAILLSGRPEADLDERTIEELHRDSEGNPARLLRLAASRPGWKASRLLKDRSISVRPDLVRTEPPTEELTSPYGGLVPSRPPIRVEDGLIEVGWEPTSEPGSDSVAATAGLVEAMTSDRRVVAVTAHSHPRVDLQFERESEYLLDDPLATLQAVREETLNRRPLSSTVMDEPDDEPNPLDDPTEPIRPAYHRPDPAEPFAPHDQLLARLREPAADGG